LKVQVGRITLWTAGKMLRAFLSTPQVLWLHYHSVAVRTQGN